MAFVDDPNENSEAQVAGSAPLGQSSAPMSETPENTPQQTASQPMAAPQAESQPKGTSSGRTAPKASSGMFNNINKYIEKNKPQAQEMATAVSQDFGKKAQEIQQNAAQKQQAQQQGLQANQQTLDTNRQFAENQVNQIMNPTQAPQSLEDVEALQPVVYNPSQQDADRFQDLMRGKIEGVNQVQDLNLAQQNIRAEALQQLADTAETEQGRRNMLGETFRKQGEYTRGMSGLDNLITSGNEQAREGLIQSVQDQAGNLTSGLSSMQTEAGQAKMAQDLAISNFGTDVSNLSGDQRNMLDQQMKDALAAELAGRATLTGDFEAASESADSYIANMLSQIQGTAYGDTVGGLTEAAYQDAVSKGIRDKDARGTNLEAFANAVKQGEDVSKLGTYIRVPGATKKTGYNQYTTGPDTYGNVQTGWHKNRTAIASLLGQLNNKFAGNELYDVKESRTYGTNDDRGKKTYSNLANSQSFYEDQYKNLGSGEDVVNKAITSEAGQGFDDYLAGKGLDQYDVAEQGDVDRYNALQRLIGGEDVIDEGRRQTDFAKQDSIQALLDKYKNS